MKIRRYELNPTFDVWNNSPQLNNFLSLTIFSSDEAPDYKFSLTHIKCILLDAFYQVKMLCVIK